MALLRTPLYQRHLDLGAKMVEFGGWEMPLQYTGILAEHRGCRSGVGLFDVSHMGELTFTGPGAMPFLQRAVVSDLAGQQIGQAKYSLLCNEQGGILDDLIVYRCAADDFLVVVNAANTPSDVAWLESLGPPPGAMRDASAVTALLAVQGPRSRELLAGLLGSAAERLNGLRYYRFSAFTLADVELLIARTGYTGDLGYELCVPEAGAVQVWDAVSAAGSACGLVHVGLGARDTLRLEAGFCLHGHDISPARNPLEADLERVVAFDKEGFVGREALLAARDQGVAERLVGLVVAGREIIREGYPILHDGERIGEVTSGSFGPSVGHAVGLGYIRAELAEPGREVTVEVRGRPVPCRLAERPFYRPA